MPTRRAGPARRPEAFAGAEAAKWSKGLAEWGQDGARIERLRDAAEFALYTPGSTSGRPLSIVKSFAAPDPEIVNDADLLQDRVTTAATSVLTLAGVDAEPMRSREHTLVATLFSESWRAGRDLDLPSLIAQIQSPPIAKVGVVDLESFFPSKDRFALAMQLNQLLAAPGFGAWLEGEPLDIDRLFYSENGRPRVSVISIAHLDDQERMFFVSLLLNEIVGWMRSQRGTSSLRALDLLRRDLRLPAAGGQPAVEGAAAHDPEAGPRVWAGAGRRDAESGRSRLQGAGERGHLDARPAADRARQGARPGRIWKGRPPDRAPPRSPRMDRLLSALGKASVPASQRS